MTKERVIEEIEWSIHVNNITKDINGSNASINVDVLKEVLFMLKTKERRIKDLECHCEECDDEIYRICEKYCNYQDEEVALCERERFANMNVEDYEKIEETLRIEKNAEDIIEKLQKENEELKHKYDKALSDLVKAEKETILAQKVKDKIEELNNNKMLIVTSTVYDKEEKLQILKRNQIKKQVLQELLEEKEE